MRRVPLLPAPGLAPSPRAIAAVIARTAVRRGSRLRCLAFLALAAVARNMSPPATSPQSTRAIPWAIETTVRPMPACASFCAASSASARICSTPWRHKKARSAAAQPLRRGPRAESRSRPASGSTASAHARPRPAAPCSHRGSRPTTAHMGCPRSRPILEPPKPPLEGRDPGLAGRPGATFPAPGARTAVDIPGGDGSTPVPTSGRPFPQAPRGGAPPRDRDQVRLQASSSASNMSRNSGGSGTTAPDGPAARAAGSTEPVRQHRPEPCDSSTASHSGPDMRSSTAVRVKKHAVPRRNPRQELRLNILSDEPVVPAERVHRAWQRATFP